MGIVTTNAASGRGVVAMADQGERGTSPPAGGDAASAQGLAEPVDPAVTTVVIVDDHTALSGALAITIDSYPDLRCVGTASTLAAARPLVERVAPDVVLLDVRLPDGNGIDAIPDLVAAPTGRARPRAHGTHGRRHAVPRGLARCERVPPEGEPGQRHHRRHPCGRRRPDARGRAHARRNPRAARGVVSGDARSDGGAVPTLTRREADVLRMMGAGHDTHAIARALGISIHTCRGYQKSMMAKLGAHSQLEAVVIGTRAGLHRPLIGPPPVEGLGRPSPQCPGHVAWPPARRVVAMDALPAPLIRHRINHGVLVRDRCPEPGFGTATPEQRCPGSSGAG